MERLDEGWSLLPRGSIHFGVEVFERFEERFGKRFSVGTHRVQSGLEQLHIVGRLPNAVAQVGRGLLDDFEAFSAFLAEAERVGLQVFERDVELAERVLRFRRFR